MRTKRDLITNVLRDLRVTGSLDQPAAEDYARVKEKYNSKLEEWRERDVVYWSNTLTSDTEAEIPDLVFETVTALVANEVAPRFGYAMSPSEKRQNEEFLLKQLRRLTALKTANRPNRADYV